ncbi:MAG: N-acetylglucosamine-6-phosphate deacetylase, partial [Caulobacter sp.]|nr:N-acetylglucosamine-6-phosphate deacetylase [Caulobacter sp.]
AMPSVGLADKTFTLQGRPIHVVNGVCVDEHGTLAGSDLDMAGAVRNAVGMMGLDLPAAVAMASASPAAFLGLAGERGRIAAGMAADLALLGEDLTVRETWIGGEKTPRP